MNKVAPWKAGSKQRERGGGGERDRKKPEVWNEKGKEKKGEGAESSQEAPLKFVHNVEISAKELPLDAAPSFFLTWTCPIVFSAVYFRWRCPGPFDITGSRFIGNET